MRLLCLLALIPVVLGDCTCESDSEDRNKGEALKYKIVAIVSILVASTIGVCLPMLGKRVPALHPERSIVFVIKAFAAGVILSTGFIHVLPDAFENLTSPCLSETPRGEFPFAGFVAMMAALGTLMVDILATSYYRKSHANKAGQDRSAEDEEKAKENHGHVHGAHAHRAGPFAWSNVDENWDCDALSDHRDLAGSFSPETIKPLVAASTFHQFFEGMGLGGYSGERDHGIVFLPHDHSRITIGIGISNVYDESSLTALIMEGIFNAASLGILIYMALVDLLAADFMSPKLQNSGGLLSGTFAALLLGAGCMSFLVKWA
ncbi:hypothetical protein ACJRO7_007143 [Eucalyptus globulus]|uniref:Uncharacterized protein n=1 Tax=Eucalyptus globulus TaxID=34317 RepID=A0ABD3IMQ1_EUCGL